MSRPDPITVFEIDLDYCNLTFGTSPCTASLGGATRYKCFNTWNTCPVKSVYSRGVKTYRFVQPSAGFPVGLNYIPCLVSASGRSGTVNIAGADERMSALGQRAVISAKLVDFADGDTLTDKYFAERISGAAQLDEPGYNPKDRLSFWTKLKARNPNYAGRPCRIVQGTLKDGVFTAVTTRSFVITNIDGPDSSGNVTIEAKDVLALAENTRALAPKAGRGFIANDIDAFASSVNLLPSGIGAEYPSGGFAVIGSEIVQYSRSGDTVFFATRGDRGTTATSHRVNDTFQPCYSPRLQRIDSALRELLVDFAGVDSAYINFSEWQLECDRWAPQLVVTADICKPEGVAGLIGELAVLGVSLWWDDVAQKIRLRINRPPDTDAVMTVTDDANIMSAKQEDRDDDRLTRVSFWTVQIDPTRAMDKSNFLRQRLLIDVDAEFPSSYGDSRVKEIYCRWLNHGADSLVRILSKRLLNRFNRQPVLYELTLDAKDDVELAQVMQVQSRVIAEPTGRIHPQLMQVIKRDDIMPGVTLKVTAQKFQFDQRYAFITENTRPSYSASNAAQRARGAYFVNNSTLVFGDGTSPYVFS